MAIDSLSAQLESGWIWVITAVVEAVATLILIIVEAVVEVKVDERMEKCLLISCR